MEAVRRNGYGRDRYSGPDGTRRSRCPATMRSNFSAENTATAILSTGGCSAPSGPGGGDLANDAPSYQQRATGASSGTSGQRPEEATGPSFGRKLLSAPAVDWKLAIRWPPYPLGPAGAHTGVCAADGGRAPWTCASVRRRTSVGGAAVVGAPVATRVSPRLHAVTGTSTAAAASHLAREPRRRISRATVPRRTASSTSHRRAVLRHAACAPNDPIGALLTLIVAGALVEPVWPTLGRPTVPPHPVGRRDRRALPDWERTLRRRRRRR